MDERPCKLIDGNLSSQKVVGYCRYHRGYLTVKQIRVHKCLTRQCVRLRKIPCEFWDKRAERKKKVIN